MAGGQQWHRLCVHAACPQWVVIGYWILSEGLGLFTEEPVACMEDGDTGESSCN